MTYEKIHVRLIDGSTGSMLSESDIPASALPDTFVVGKTALTVSARSWTVSKAEPWTRDEFAETGQLTLTLTEQVAQTSVPREAPAEASAPVEAQAPMEAPAPVPAEAPVPAVAPAEAAAKEEAPAPEVQYPVPTTCEAMPEKSATGQNDGTGFVIAKDDWRQVELISTQFESAIEAELADIDAVVRDHSIKSSDTTRAYKKLFVRKRIKAPVTPQVPAKAITSTLPENTWTYGGFGFEGTGGKSGSRDAMLTNGFAYDLRSCVIYGQLADGAATVIGLKFGQGTYGDPAVIGAYLDKLMTSHSLVLVDWNWRRKITGGAAGIASYIEKKSKER